jgi:hypothetical protein
MRAGLVYNSVAAIFIARAFTGPRAVGVENDEPLQNSIKLLVNGALT